MGIKWIKINDAGNVNRSKQYKPCLFRHSDDCKDCR